VIRIGSNIASLNAQRRLDDTSQNLGKIYERLASGQRINRASDDAASLAISETLQATSRVYGQAARNLNDGISMINVAQGALTELTSIITRQKELTTQSLNGTFSYQQRKALDAESDALTREYNRIVESTALNGLYLLDGSNTGNGTRIQAGFGIDGSLLFRLGGEMGTAAGTGQLTAGANTSGTTSADVVSGDVNGDGIADLISSQLGTGSVVVKINDGTGQFSASQTITTSSSMAHMQLVDIDDDGKLDLLAMRAGTNELAIFKGNGNGTFQNATTYFTGTSSPEFYGRTAIADFNQDGKLDLVQAGTDAIFVSVGDGQGGFGAAVSFATGLTVGGRVAVGDIDGDGKLDIVSSDGQTGFTARVMLANGDGTFRQGAAMSSAGNFGIQDLQVADLNNDGKAEVLISEVNSADVSVFSNNNGTFTRTSYDTSAHGGNRSGKILVQDFNNDGYKDFTVVDWDNSRAFTFLNNNSGSFSTPTTVAISNQGATGATSADFNNDGTFDIVGGGNNTTAFNTIDPRRRNNKVDFLELERRFGASNALRYLDARLESLGREMGAIGAFQSRMETALRNVQSARENFDAANSRLRDADIAEESANLVRTQILQQTAAAVLAQANLSPALALKLLAS